MPSDVKINKCIGPHTEGPKCTLAASWVFEAAILIPTLAMRRFSHRHNSYGQTDIKSMLPYALRALSAIDATSIKLVAEYCAGIRSKIGYEYSIAEILK